MSDWARDSTIEKLRQIRVGNPPHTFEHRAADEEIRRREAEQMKKDAEIAAKIEAERHQESAALGREAISESRRANRFALIAIVIALLALIVAIVSWLCPRI